MTKFKGDTVDEFMDAANAKYGGSNLGDTDAAPTFKYGKFADGKLTKLVFTCPITLDYAEIGAGKPDANNKKAIAEVAALAESHEEKHKAYYEKAFKAWGPDKVAKKLMDDTYPSQKAADKAVADAFAELKKALLDACLDLHKKEGIVEVTTQKDGSIDVKMKPAGASGCS